MKIEDQVCSLKQSKILRDLGVSFETEFFYLHNTIEYRWGIVHRSELKCNAFFNIKDQFHIYPAYTVAELGCMLPGCGWTTHIRKLEKRVLLSIIHDDDPCNEFEENSTFVGETEAQARAESLIWLLENKYINPKKLKL